MPHAQPCGRCQTMLVALCFVQAATSASIAYSLRRPVALDRGDPRPALASASRGARAVTWYEHKVREFPQGYRGGLEAWLDTESKDGWHQVAGSPYLPRFEFERPIAHPAK